ncbi:heterokaryon incompatibility protein-domain-containing protein [Rhexocercosporidium sp. MPI-PUGE-AT-0058]|nr:heterokaryon incompatibility protein-domain-containing protein [Rhexocercosporidium sp. MPI-PUGE-AT-0058]
MKRSHEDDDDVPDKRAEHVLPVKKKRKFQDGTPVSNPREALQRVIKKVAGRYQFQSLGPDEDIRVLVLEPGFRADVTQGREKADPVICTLIPRALPSTQAAPSKKPLRYEALSYYWGQDDDDVPITIMVYKPTRARPSIFDITQKTFWIRPNLHAALVELRSTKKPVHLWVDALCINQKDDVEKAAQVSRMNEIYSEASNICIWLGVGEMDPETSQVNPDGTKSTFEFIRDMLSLKRLDRLITDPTSAGRWLAFVELMRNRWFSRRWVVQELALAKQATVHYGQQVMQWSDFADAVALFVTKHDQINRLLKNYNPTDPDPIGDMRALGANTLAEATSNLFRKSKDGAIQERLLSLETLVSTLLAFEATNPLDTVYAVLSIANDTPYSNAGDPRIVPNYDKSLAELCSDFIDYCVEKSESLDIICRHWAPVPKDQKQPLLTLHAELVMPTWVSSIAGSAFGAPEVALQGRSNGDSLVGVPSRQHRKNYNASGNLKPAFKIERQVKVTPTDQKPSPLDSAKCPTALLFARGLRLDTIGKLSPRAAQGMILQEVLEMGGLNADDDDLKKVPDSLWRTLVADRGPNDTNAPSWYHRACLECLAQVTQNGDLSTGALIENTSTASTMVTFLKRVQQVVWNRKFLLSKGPEDDEEEKLFGLAPTHAQEGDLICVLFGCSVPVILREMRSEDDCYYYFIGESYIHGMMDGEALTLGKSPPEFPYHDYQEFKIR